MMWVFIGGPKANYCEVMDRPPLPHHEIIVEMVTLDPELLIPNKTQIHRYTVLCDGALLYAGMDDNWKMSND